MEKKRRLLDEYRFPGYRPRANLQGVFGDPKARVIHLERTQKKLYAGVVALFIGYITTRKFDGYEIYLVGMQGYTLSLRFGVSGANGAKK